MIIVKSIVGILVCACCGTVVWATLASSSIGQEFRIESYVYRAGVSEPVSENLTLFTENRIFDFMLKTDQTRFPQEIAIYESDKKQFVLLDTARRTKVRIAESELVNMLAALRVSSADEDNYRFLYQPDFEETYDAASGWLTLRGEQLVYRAKGTRPEQGIALQKYYEFIDRFAQLSVTNPRQLPPFARLQLNSALKKKGILASDVEVTLQLNSAAEEPLEMRSEHVVMWELSDTDLARIKSAERYIEEFTDVSLREFRKLETQTLDEE